VRIEDITAVILSGGNSRRMGTNKALLNIGGKSIINRLIDILDSIFFEVLISSNNPNTFKFTEKKIIADIFPNRGPLAGIHSALSSINNKKVFILSCDMPLISDELIQFLCKYRTDKPIILPEAEGRIQQLCGIYSKSALNMAENLLSESQRTGSKLKGSIYELIEKLDREVVKVDNLEFYHPDIFFNLNTPEDYEYLKKCL